MVSPSDDQNGDSWMLFFQAFCNKHHVTIETFPNAVPKEISRQLCFSVHLCNQKGQAFCFKSKKRVDKLDSLRCIVPFSEALLSVQFSFSSR